MKKYLPYVPLVFTLAAIVIMSLPKSFAMELKTEQTDIVKYVSYFSNKTILNGEFMPALTALTTIASAVFMIFSAFSRKFRGIAYGAVSLALLFSVFAWTIRDNPMTVWGIAVSASLALGLAAAVLFNRRKNEEK